MGIKNIFQSSSIYHPDPQRTWMFAVKFDFNGQPFNSEKFPDLISIKVDLPKTEIKTITKNFLGSERTFPIYRSDSGESTLEFYCRNGIHEFAHFFGRDSTQFNEYGDYEHNEFDSFYLKNFRVELYTQNGEFECEYRYENVIITEMNLGNLSYEDENILRLEMTIHYDSWAKSLIES